MRPQYLCMPLPKGAVLDGGARRGSVCVWGLTPSPPESYTNCLFLSWRRIVIPDWHVGIKDIDDGQTSGFRWFKKIAVF